MHLTAALDSDRSLPKPQRRGAVVILGMLALARRSVIADRTDALMKTGLGKLGQVRSRTGSSVASR